MKRLPPQRSKSKTTKKPNKKMPAVRPIPGFMNVSKLLRTIDDLDVKGDAIIACEATNPGSAGYNEKDNVLIFW